MALPDRPGDTDIRRGNVPLETNSFRMNLDRVNEIFVYDISFCSGYEAGSKRRERRLFQLTLGDYPVMAHAATDYKQTLVSASRLTDHDSSTNIEVFYYENGTQRPLAGQDQDSTYWICVAFRKILSLRPFRGYLNQPTANTTYTEKNQAVNALNLLLSRVAGQSNDVHDVGKTRMFNTSRPVQPARNLQGGLEAFIGSEKIVRTSQTGSLLNINSSTSAFYRILIVDNLINEWALYESGSRDLTLRRQYVDANIFMLNRFLRGVRVRASYPPQRFYSIWRVAEPTQHWAGRAIACNVRFEMQEYGKSARTISVLDYFLEKYPTSSGQLGPDVLVVDVGDDDHVTYIPSNLLNILPGNHYRHVLSGSQQLQMIKTACQSPRDNQNIITAFGLPLLGVQQPVSGNGPEVRFNVQVDLRMLRLEGFYLPSPILTYRSWNDPQLVNNAPKFVPQNTTRRGTWNLDKLKFIAGGGGGNGRWSYLELHDHTGACDEGERNAFIGAIGTNLRKYCEFQGARPHMLTTNNIRRFPAGTPSNIQNSPASILQGYKDKDVQILFVILSSQNIANYAALKLAADVRVGIHTTVAVKVANWARNIPPQQPKRHGAPSFPVRQLKHDSGVIANILHKVNLRLGGINTQLFTIGAEAWRRPQLFTATTMIVGADVTHPGTASKQKCPSIAAVVASSDDAFNHYTASLRCQEGKREDILELGAMLVERLDFWRTNIKNNSRLDRQLYPDQLAFFRDGVSESQFQMILHDEWPQIQAAFRDTYDRTRQPRPKWLLITALKRHATRFFPERQ